MIIAYDMIGTPEGDAWVRLSYSDKFPYTYKADLEDCPEDVRKVLKKIDKDMAFDSQYPHAIENWQDL